MRRIVALCFGLMVGAAAMWGGLKYHFVRTADGLVTAPKRSASLSDTYVDARTWSVLDWSRHPDLVWAMSASGHTSAMTGAGTFEASLDQAFDGFRKR